MSQKKDQKNATILDSIQSEVSKEASPLLEFLIRNSKKIALLVVLVIVAAAAFGGWTVYSENQVNAAREELGLLVVRPESEAKLAALEKFAADAPAELKTGAYLALASSAAQAGRHDLAASAWGQIASLTGSPMHFTAQLGEAASLKDQGKGEQALMLLESMLSGTPAEMSPVLNSAILDLAEDLGQWDRALQACNNILNDESISADKAFWRQRAEYLRLKKQSAEG